MSAPQPPEILPPEGPMDDLYSQLAKGNALVINAAMQQATANASNLLTIATGAMMAKILMSPVSADSLAMLSKMSQADPFGAKANPLETDGGAV